MLSPWYIQCTQNIKNIFNFNTLLWKIHLQNVFSQRRNYKVFRIEFQSIQLVRYPTSVFPIKFWRKSDILCTFSIHEKSLRINYFFWIHRFLFFLRTLWDFHFKIGTFNFNVYRRLVPMQCQRFIYLALENQKLYNL